ncbi:MAG TPA: zinc ribbon domain-containing protein [Anaerolineales bacterium]
MSTICPNCQRPVRAGAKYCGFCGSSLITAGEVNAFASPALPEQTDLDFDANPGKLPGSKYDKTSQTVALTAIILLFLVIIVALFIRYWPYISVWLNKIFPGLNIS